MRIDQLLVERGLFESRALARAAIEAGLVRADGVAVDKPARQVEASARLEAIRPFETVSRAGLKLAAALEAFAIDPAGRVCLDLGASTGGFVDLLLRRGAQRVYAVDVGHGQLHASLRARPEIVSLEGLDARAISGVNIPESPSLLTADLAFISLAKALPAALQRLSPRAEMILLVKPQFEAGPGAGKHGVIRDVAIHTTVLRKVMAELAGFGLVVLALAPSPIAGGDGNREFLLHASKPA